jgi:Flp pilus assembly pilin Flp
VRRLLKALRRDARGASAIEFALVAPLLIVIIVGTAQMGRLYLANAGLRNLVADSARFASVWPRPTDTAIKDRLRSGGFGLEQSRLGEPVVTYGTEGGANYATIEARYSVQLNFIFWQPAPIQLAEQRRVFIYAAPAT